MDTSEEKHRQIITLYETGNYSHRAISYALNIPKSTVSRIIQLWHQTGNTRSRRFGRSPTTQILSMRVERAMVRHSYADPQATARQVQHLQGGEALDVHIRTVQCILRVMGGSQ